MEVWCMPYFLQYYYQLTPWLSMCLCKVRTIVCFICLCVYGMFVNTLFTVSVNVSIATMAYLVCVSQISLSICCLCRSVNGCVEASHIVSMIS